MVVVEIERLSASDGKASLGFAQGFRRIYGSDRKIREHVFHHLAARLVVGNAWTVRGLVGKAADDFPREMVWHVSADVGRFHDNPDTSSPLHDRFDAAAQACRQNLLVLRQ